MVVLVVVVVLQLEQLLHHILMVGIDVLFLGIMVVLIMVVDGL